MKRKGSEKRGKTIRRKCGEKREEESVVRLRKRGRGVRESRVGKVKKVKEREKRGEREKGKERNAGGRRRGRKPKDRFLECSGSEGKTGRILGKDKRVGCRGVGKDVAGTGGMGED